MIAQNTHSLKGQIMLSGHGGATCGSIIRSMKEGAKRPNIISLLIDGATLTHYATDREAAKWRVGDEYEIMGYLGRQEYNGKLVIDIKHIKAATADTPPFRVSGPVRAASIEHGEYNTRVELTWRGGSATVPMSADAASNYELDVCYEVVGYLIIDPMRGGLALRIQAHKLAESIPHHESGALVDQVTGDVEEPEESVRP